MILSILPLSFTVRASRTSFPYMEGAQKRRGCHYIHPRACLAFDLCPKAWTPSCLLFQTAVALPSFDQSLYDSYFSCQPDAAPMWFFHGYLRASSGRRRLGAV